VVAVGDQGIDGGGVERLQNVLEVVGGANADAAQIEVERGGIDQVLDLE
jgi:hypothetical protein